ncbi:NrfD/PsrC family molybdoenzyme membrane anchor subunit [Cytobacillus sp. Hz8]|uniref:NrfD/PsrC family molybdoenzyme membrane anchor subunit n=1 Tax=Cytobacillus sp. Hz8 TaxID=3347168 RepID=UPI0035DF6D74
MDNITYLYNVNHHVYWGILIAIYFFYTGISAGAFLISSLGNVFGIKKYKMVEKTGVILSIVFLAIAPLHLIADLQQPAKFWHLLVNIHFTSAMSYGVFLLLIYFLTCIIYAWFIFREDLARYLIEKNNWRSKLYSLIILKDKRLDNKTLNRDAAWKRRLGIFGILLALLLEGYTGFLLADVQTRALWHNALMPWIFLMSALVSGTGVFIVVLMIVEKSKVGMLVPEVKKVIVDMTQLMKWFIVIDGAMLISTFITLWYGNQESYAAGYFLLRGDEQVGFIGIELILGLLVPLILMSLPKIKESNVCIVISSILAIIGVVAMRINFVIGGQKIPLTGNKILQYQIEPSQLTIVISFAIAASIILAFFYYLLPMNHNYTPNHGKNKNQIGSQKGA